MTTDNGSIPEVSPVEASGRISAGAWAVDVREVFEWDEGRIADAVHNPLGLIQDWWQDLPRDRDVVIYCRTGARSGRAVAALVNAGVDNVVNLAGGIEAWVESGLPIEEP